MLFPGAKIPLIVVAPVILPAPPRVAPDATLTGTVVPVAEPDVLFTKRVPSDTLNADPEMLLPADLVRLRVPVPVLLTEVLAVFPPVKSPLIINVPPLATSKMLFRAEPPPPVRVTCPSIVEVPVV
jgi:hypothetical protein